MAENYNKPDPVDAIRVPEGVPKIITEVDERLDSAVKFRVMREDHTVGNLVRMQLLRDPQVKFAGYRIPHPLEKDIEILVQTKDKKTAPPLELLKRASTLLGQELTRVKEQFETSLRELERRKEEEFA